MRNCVRRSAFGVRRCYVVTSLWVFSFFAIFFLTTATSYGESAERRTPNAERITIDMSATPTTSIAVGDRVTVTVTYRWPHNSQITEPDPTAAFSKEFTTDLPPPKKISTGDEERRIFTITLAATRSGAWALPRPSITVGDFHGPYTATAPEIIIQVGADAKPPALPAARKAWIKPPASEESHALRWWLIGGACALCLGVIGWFTLRRGVLIAAPTPLETFTREWQAASTSSDGKEAGARLSLALRRYAGAIWKFDGPGSTTRETAMQVKGRLPDDEYATLMRLLDRLDDLRWSAQALPIAALEREIGAAQEWTTGVQQRLDAEAAAAAEAAKSPRTAKRLDSQRPASSRSEAG